MNLSADDITLRDYFEARFKAIHDVRLETNSALYATIAALKELWQAEHVDIVNRHTVGMAAMQAAMDKRFDSVNGFRAALSDQTATLMPRTEVQTMFAMLDSRVSVLSDRVTALSSAGTGRREMWGYTAGVIGLVIGLLSLVFRTQKP